MNLNFFYIIGIFLLFFGLFWSFLPHIYHEKINLNKDIESNLNDNKDNLEKDHLAHILIGIPPAVLGIIMIEYLNRKKKLLKNS